MDDYDIAVCIPSLNEVSTIEKTTRVIALGLKKYFPRHRAVIINADNNSIDGTKEKFLTTPTDTIKKKYISTLKTGKGENIISFMQFVQKKNIPFLAMFDADLKSIKPSWVKKMLMPIVSGSADYVTPIYKRNRYEGNTTNHVCFPVIYALFGVPIRQPIAGDFAFNLKYVKKFLQLTKTSSNCKYGIDISMTLTALLNSFSVVQVKLEEKIHNPSFGKMVPMFREVANSLIETLNKYYSVNKFSQVKLQKISRLLSTISTNVPISIEARAKRKIEAVDLAITLLKKKSDLVEKRVNYALDSLNNERKYNYEDFNIVLNDVLVMITKGEVLTESKVKEYAEVLLVCYLTRVLSYLDEVKEMLPREVDLLVCNQAKHLSSLHNKGLVSENRIF